MKEDLSYDGFLKWASAYEDMKLKGVRPNYRIYEDAFEKALILVKPFFGYFSGSTYANMSKRQLLYNAAMHYCIVTKQEILDEQGNIISQNALYEKYKISERSMIVTSASDESSSASMLTPSSMNDGDFTMLDLARTTYGLYVYSLLEKLGRFNPVL